MIRKVLPFIMLLVIPLVTAAGQEESSLTGDLKAMAGLYAAGEYRQVVDYTPTMKDHFARNQEADPFYRDLALFLLWASRMEMGESDRIRTEMDYYFHNEGKTGYRSLPPLLSAFLYIDLLTEAGEQEAARLMADTILSIPDYEGTLALWAESGDRYDIVLFSSSPFLESLMRRRKALVPQNTVAADNGERVRIINPEESRLNLTEEGNFMIRHEESWFRVFWKHPFTNRKEAETTGRALLRDRVIKEFVIKEDRISGRWLIQVGALRSEKTALDWEKELEGLTGGYR